jgi:threonyl-tRNA synthetase
VELDLRNEKLGYKIREAQLQKIPYILVIGDKEVEQGGVAPRLRSGDDLGFMTLDDFVARIKPEIGPPRLT